MSRRRRKSNKGSDLAAPSSSQAPLIETAAAGWSWWIVLVALAGIFAYANSLGGAFVFDDTQQIVENPSIRHMGDLATVLGHGPRPVVALSLAVNYAAGGLNVGSYHIFNIVIHVIAALTLFGVVRRTLMLARWAGRFDASSDRYAGVVALLWVLHPLQTQSVTYLTQRAESMMGMFLFLTLYCVLRGACALRGRMWYVAAVVACALGMGSKPVMVIAPIVVLAFDATFLAGAWLGALSRRRGLYAGLASTWLVLLLCGVVQNVFSAESGSTVGLGYRGLSPVTYLLSQAGVLIHYLQLCVWPDELVLDYWWPYAQQTGEIALPGALVLALLIATALGLIRRRWWGFAGVWFFAILAPTSSIIPIRDLAVEHRMYLPLAGVIVIVVFGVDAAMRSLFRRAGLEDAHRGVILTVLVAVVAISLGVRTSVRNHDYASALTMWQDVIEKRPENPRAHYNLGREFVFLGDAESAMDSYRNAILQSDQYADAELGLGKVLMGLGRLEEGLAAIKRASRLNPASDKIAAELGAALVDAGRHQEAVPYLRKALKVTPGDVVLMSALGAAFAELGSLEEAENLLRAARKRQPDHAGAAYQLGNVLAGMGRFQEAIEQYEAALVAEPDHLEARVNLATTLGRTGSPQEAMRMLDSIVQSNPEQVAARYNLGNLYNQAGRAEEAMQAYEAVIAISPSHVRARTNLGNVLLGQGRLDDAIAAYEGAVQADGTHVIARVNLGMALEQAGRSEEAIEHYREALRVNPNFTPADNALSAALKRQGW